MSDGEVLLSFHLGSPESYVWAVTRKSFRIYRLCAEEQIRSEVAAFHQAVAAKSREAVPAGERLYSSLFGQLEPEQSTTALVVHHPAARYFNVGAPVASEPQSEPVL